eukprot:tig00020563_g11232.t1
MLCRIRSWVASFAPLPNKKVLVSDYNCRLRLYDPAINVISAFGGPDGDLGSPAGAYNLQCATAATPENTVRPFPRGLLLLSDPVLRRAREKIGQRPSNATGRMLTGVIRGLAYSSVEDRVFFSWEVDTMRRSEIWSVRTDGGDAVVVAKRSSPPDSQRRTAFIGITADRNQPYIYSVSADENVFKISTRPPYTMQQIAEALGGGPDPLFGYGHITRGSSGLAFVQDAACAPCDCCS